MKEFIETGANYSTLSKLFSRQNEDAIFCSATSLVYPSNDVRSSYLILSMGLCEIVVYNEKPSFYIIHRKWDTFQPNSGAAEEARRFV